MSDIVERLKSSQNIRHLAAANEIERLRADNEKLRAELDGLLDCSKAYDAMAKLCSETEWTLKNEIAKLRAALKPLAQHAPTHEYSQNDTPVVIRVLVKDLRAAAAALKETGDE